MTNEFHWSGRRCDVLFSLGSFFYIVLLLVRPFTVALFFAYNSRPSFFVVSFSFFSTDCRNDDGYSRLQSIPSRYLVVRRDNVCAQSGSAHMVFQDRSGR